MSINSNTVQNRKQALNKCAKEKTLTQSKAELRQALNKGVKEKTLALSGSESRR